MSALMIYAIVLGILLSGSAHFLDMGVRALGRPTRWLWIMAMAAVAGAPVLSRLWVPAPSGSPPGSLPVELLYQLLAQGMAEGTASAAIRPALDRPLVFLWVLSSALVVLAVIFTSLRLHRTARGWKRQTLGTEEITVSHGLGPAVLGLFRPIIVLPSWALSLAREKLDMILLHEREHRDARDPALLTLGLLMVAIAPWNPALWWMARRLHLAVEGDCDGRVLEKGISAKAYGNILLEVASGAQGLSSLAPALAEGGQTFLERRLLMIRQNVGKHRFGTAALATLSSAGLLILACETPTPPVQMETEVTLEAPPATSEMAPDEEGYFLVRKSGDEVEYVAAGSPEKVKEISEQTDPPPSGQAFTVRKIEQDPEASGAEPEIFVDGAPVQKEAGQILLRGESDGPEPLIIIDGVITDNTLADIGSLDVESIEIVKGEQAKALYGERAVGGVILITMKH